MFDIRRRQFLTLLGGAAAVWPLAAYAQQPTIPMIGFLSSGSQQSDVWRLTAFRRGLSETGYIEGRNVVSEFRWSHDQYHRLPALAAELARSQLAVMVAVGAPAAALAAKAASPTVPVVFAIAGDPVKLGLVASINRPGGNATGVSTVFSSVVAKQFEILHEMMPRATVIGCLVNPKNPNVVTGTREAQEAARALRDLASPSEMGMLGAIQAVIPAFAMPFIAVGGRDAADFERGIEEFAREPNGGLIILPSPNTLVHRRAIMAMAARHRLPAIYPYGFFAREGGLLSYGIVPADNFRRAAAYVERILKGANPGELPVQVPTKFELVLNLKTAKTLGLEIPPKLLATADELIE